MILCCICDKNIYKKPWLSVLNNTNTETSHVCSYICSNKIDTVVGKRYMDRIVNKEDFENIILPTSKYQISKESQIQSTEYEMIQRDIDYEEQLMFEMDLYEDSFSECSDEEKQQ